LPIDTHLSSPLDEAGVAYNGEPWTWISEIVPQSFGDSLQVDTANTINIDDAVAGFDINDLFNDGIDLADTNKPYVCSYHGCYSSFKIKTDLARHQREKHGDQEYLCPVDTCPRSIEGEGFLRNDRLVIHLVWKKYSMAKQQAKLKARKKNGK
jgi:hypothetical protein